MTQDTPPPKPKLTPEERRARYTDRLTTIRLRMLIFRELDERGISTPAEIGAAMGMLPAEAAKLLRGHQWREGDCGCWRGWVEARSLGQSRPGAMKPIRRHQVPEAYVVLPG
jgi:hypothetical protein